MKQTNYFKFLLLSLLMLVGAGSAWADETLFSAVCDVTSDVKLAASTTSDITTSQATISGGSMKFTNGDTKEQKYLAKQKNRGAFCIGASTTYFTITLNTALQAGDKINFDLYTANGDTKIGLKINSTIVSEATTPSSTAWVSAPEYTVTAGDGLVGKTELKVERTQGKGTYFTNFVITTPVDDTRDESTVSFGSTTSATVDMATATTYQLPTPTTTPSGLTVTYESDKTSVATVNGTGMVTLVSAGTAKITAKFAGNTTHKPSSAVFTLTVENSNDKIFVNAGGEATMTNSGAVAVTHKVWDFTSWSAATVANLKADAATSKSKGWSDIESATGTEPTDISKDNCFWSVANTTVGGELTANGEVIEELKGLVFHNAYSTLRALAIAVNYPSTSLGTYAGASYLWLGNKKRTCFTIKNVKVGSTLKITAESHNPSDARGVKLYQNSTSGAEIGSFTPKTQDTKTFTVTGPSGAETVDVVVYNTNGCHIYSIEADIAEAKTMKLQLKKDIVVTSGTEVALGNGSVKMTFSEDGGNDFAAAADNSSVSGYTSFTAGNNTNGNAEKGTFYTFEPKYPGTITVAVVLNNGRDFFITEDGTAMAGYPIQKLEKYYGTFEFNVQGGKKYKVYASGTKLGFYGFEYNANVAANAAEFKALSTGTVAQATLTDVKVTAVNGTEAYVEDATAGIKLVLPSEGLLAVGDLLNGTIILQRTATGAGAVAATSLAGVAKTAGEATPTTATAAQALDAAKQDMYVSLSGVTVTTDGETVYVNQGGKTIKVVNTLFADAITTISGKKQLESIAGIVTADGLAPTKAADIVLGENADKLKTVANIAAFKALADKEQAQLTLTDAYVTYKGEGFSFVQDASGAIVVEDKLTTDAAGKKLNGYFSAQLDILNNGIEKQGTAITEACDYTSADGVFIPTVYNDLNTLKSPDLLYSMVRVGRSKISIEGGVSTLETANGTGTITVRDALDTGVNVPENLTFFTGIVLYDKNGYLLAPVHVDSLQEYVASVTDYVVDKVEDGDTLKVGDTKILTGIMMTTTADAPVVAEAKTVGEGQKQKNFTAKIEGNNYQFEATKTGVLTVYTEKQPKQKLNVTEDGEAMKDFTDFEQKLDSIQIPVTAGHSYLLSTTEPPLNLYGFTFSANDKNALDLARNIATFKKLYDGMVAVEDTLMLNDAVVTYIKGDNVFVEDASGAIVFRETQIQFYVGQKLNGFIIGKNKDYKKMPILTRSAKTKNSEFKVERGTAQSKPITIEEALKEESLARFVTLSNVRPDRDRYGFRVLTDAAGNSIRIDDYFNVFFELPEYIKTIEGIVGIDAEGTHFFWPTSKEGVVAKPVPADFETGKYYLKNVGSGLFWGAGNDWGTRGSLLKHAEYVTLLAQGDGVYKMETQVSNGGTAYYFEGDYMDNANPMSLTISKTKTEGVYTIASPEEKLFGYDGTSTVLGKDVAAGENAQWQILSEADMQATLSAAAADAPVDATFLILDPNFGRNNRNQSAWTVSEDCTNKNLSGGNNTNNCAESYMSVFTISQTIDVPNGKYVLNAQAAVTFHDNREIKEYDGNGYPQIFANDKVSNFNDMIVEDRLSNMGKLSEQFTAGMYAVEPIEVIVTDGKLTIGAKSERADIWAIWDNFELTYYGPAAAPVVTSRVWDFTTWSAATVADLKADAAASKTSGWSDVEKKADAEADKEPTEASKDNCFWLAGAPNENGELTANGKVISELKGLKFYNTYAANRSLAIAVNYPETSLGTYAGASYLWLGGGKNSLAVFTIPNVTAGSTITVEVESHKPAEGRGIELYGAVGSDDKVVADSKIGDSFTPKTKESHSWTIENDGDVTIYNTNGCHIYILKVEAPQQKQFNVTYALAEGETHAAGDAVSIKDETNEELATLTFGDTGNDFKAAKAEGSVEGFTAFTEGNGTNGNADGGTYYFFKPKYDGKADFAVVLNSGKKFYIEEDGTALADYNGITVDEKKYGTFTRDVKGGSTYKVYCAGSKLGFYGVKYYNTDDIVTSIQQAPAVRIADDAIYNLRGQKVTGTLKPGLYIKNGKKIIVK